MPNKADQGLLVASWHDCLQKVSMLSELCIDCNYPGRQEV